MCKHVAPTLYGVGARLDAAPELLFVLRAVDHLKLIQQAAASANLDRALDSVTDESLVDADLGAMFGIELETAPPLDAKRKGGSKSREKEAASSLSPSRKLRGTQSKATPAPKDASGAKLRKRPSAPAKATMKRRGKSDISSGK
jgi:uncharacterized Zn finger protein